MTLEALWVGAGNYTLSPRLRARFPVPVPIEIHPNKEHLVVEAATTLKDLEVGLPEPCKSQKLSPYLVKLLASPVSVVLVLVPSGVGSFYWGTLCSATFRFSACVNDATDTAKAESAKNMKSSTKIRSGKFT